MPDSCKDVHSLSSFKRNTNTLLQRLKQTRRPMLLTVNGQAEVVLQDAEAYQELLELAERARAIEAVRRGLDDVEAGRTQPAAEAFEEIRRELQIPRDGG
jgi:PHD/YefM family antitoxin component YafN of YafNO toxin-antitoxin module